MDLRRARLPFDAALRVVVTSTASDAHSWNLIYLQLRLEEAGHVVTNFGPCVNDQSLLARCRQVVPDLIVFSTVNGHGRQDGERIIRLIRNAPDLQGLPVVIGGMLGVAGPDGNAAALSLQGAGFDAVFGPQGDIDRFLEFVRELSADRARRGSRPVGAAR
ncbi:cobalamin B12-binding domain-containing protein [Streptomyces sp. NRRL F-5126]|uniref:cobalamin B12-binding domain-containing protein n=1 Tax=Streptomyces sp. NRRL F-5126 TaxID=1463857 RepID=UPI000D146118|nr:cobalamin B12-binding domain-containing protein [Streptomyces sp. NRRL F-5126]